MPELPEVERARAAIEVAGLGRRIADVDDTDTYECRPHAPGEIRQALVGRALTAAHRRGKTMWCDTSGVGRSRTPGPILGLHLGMAGRIVISPAVRAGRTAAGRAAPGETASGETVEGGDPRPRRALPGETRWNRFTLFFADGGSLVLLDPRRLGRVRLDPAVDVLGPDALTITVGQFRLVMARGTAPVKARLLDQSAIAGVGNLLADEALVAGPHRPAPPGPVRSRRPTSPTCTGPCDERWRRPCASAAPTPVTSSPTVVPAGNAPAAGPNCATAPSAAARPGGARSNRCDRPVSAEHLTSHAVSGHYSTDSLIN